MLLHLALHEDGASARVEARAQEIQRHFKRIGRNLRGVSVVGSERVQVGDEEVALVLVLKLDPVGQGTHVIAQVELAGGTHSAQNARAGRMKLLDSGIVSIDSGMVPGDCSRF